MINKIAVAVDTNSEAKTILEKAIELAHSTDAEIALVNCVSSVAYIDVPNLPYDSFNSGPPQINVDAADKNTHEAEHYATGFLNDLKNSCGYDKVDVYVLNDNVTDALLNFCDTWKADILTMGSHARHGLSKLLQGDESVNMLHKTKIPLYLVPLKK